LDVLLLVEPNRREWHPGLPDESFKCITIDKVHSVLREMNIDGMLQVLLEAEGIILSCNGSRILTDMKQSRHVVRSFCSKGCTCLLLYVFFHLLDFLFDGDDLRFNERERSGNET
jgi:hypothetical protein